MDEDYENEIDSELTPEEDLEDCFQLASELQARLELLQDSFENSRSLICACSSLDDVMEWIDEVMSIA